MTKKHYNFHHTCKQLFFFSVTFDQCDVSLLKGKKNLTDPKRLNDSIYNNTNYYTKNLIKFPNNINIYMNSTSNSEIQIPAVNYGENKPTNKQTKNLVYHVNYHEKLYIISETISHTLF